MPASVPQRHRDAGPAFREQRGVAAFPEGQSGGAERCFMPVGTARARLCSLRFLAATGRQRSIDCLAACRGSGSPRKAPRADSRARAGRHGKRCTRSPPARLPRPTASRSGRAWIVRACTVPTSAGLCESSRGAPQPDQRCASDSSSRGNVESRRPLILRRQTRVAAREPWATHRHHRGAHPPVRRVDERPVARAPVAR